MDYAIGDVQGCYRQLLNLLDVIEFNEAFDRLWFVGDLVNRGPDSLKVLQFVRQLKTPAVITLGNHDLHFLARAYGIDALKSTPTPNPQGFKSHLERDSLDELLAHPECLDLAHWLRHQSLLHHSQAFNLVMVHAGIPPVWDLNTARACAREVESVLQGPDYLSFFAEMYGNEPSMWSEELAGIKRWRFIVNALTRMRYCEFDGRLNLRFKGHIEEAPQSVIPWFKVSPRHKLKGDVVFGHWAALNGCVDTKGIYGIDTGCLWGGSLTALRLADRRLFSVPGWVETGER